MALDPAIRRNLVLPVICAPMFLVTGPALVREACKAGIIGAFPRMNARDFGTFESWLKEIRTALDIYATEHPKARIGPMAVNLATSMPADEVRKHLDVCGRHGVNLIISAVGNPAELVRHVHDWGGKVFHDVTSLRFAEKAVAAKVDGLICIGAGGGGHSGGIGHLVLIPKIRAMFGGTIVMAGSVTTGAAIRAAEILGADLAYMGTRFIATREADVDADYKAMLVSESATDLLYTPKISGVAANWLVKSMRAVGLDPADLPAPHGAGMRHDHLPETVKPWKNLWSAGQGIDLIQDIPAVAELVTRLRREYVAACATPNMAEVAELVTRAQDAAV